METKIHLPFHYPKEAQGQVGDRAYQVSQGQIICEVLEFYTINGVVSIKKAGLLQESLNKARAWGQVGQLRQSTQGGIPASRNPHRSVLVHPAIFPHQKESQGIWDAQLVFGEWGTAKTWASKISVKCWRDVHSCRGPTFGFQYPQQRVPNPL